MSKKSIIITGANGAIGAYFVKRFLQEGYQVLALVHHNCDRVQDIVSSVSERDKFLTIKSCELTDYNELKQRIEEYHIEKGFIPISLIHTAALRSNDHKLLADTEGAHWWNIVEVNILSCYNLLHILIPYYQRLRDGRIVFLGSNISRTGLKFGTAYAVSKGALANLTRTVSLEYSEYNILINTISPGPVNVDQSHFPEHYQEFRKEYFKKELQNIPINRFVEPEDLFKSCLFFASEQNSYITGEEIYLTGGKV